MGSLHQSIRFLLFHPFRCRNGIHLPGLVHQRRGGHPHFHNLAGSTTRLGASSFVTPSAIASVVGMALFLGNIQLPSPIGRALGLLGDTTTPLSMVLIGGIVSRMSFRTALGSLRLYATSLYRLALFPLGLFLVLYLLGLRGMLLSLPVILAAMPVAANSAILAQAYGGDSRTASSLVLVSTLLSLLSIPLLASIRFPV